MNYDAEKTTLEAEDLEKMENRNFVMVGATEPRIVGQVKTYRIFDTVLETSDKRIVKVSFFESEYSAVVKLIQSLKLKGSHGIQEFGIQLTLACVEYTRTDKTKAKKIVIEKVLPPAQSLISA